MELCSPAVRKEFSGEVCESRVSRLKTAQPAGELPPKKNLKDKRVENSRSLIHNDTNLNCDGKNEDKSLIGDKVPLTRKPMSNFSMLRNALSFQIVMETSHPHSYLFQSDPTQFTSKTQDRFKRVKFRRAKYGGYIRLFLVDRPKTVQQEVSTILEVDESTLMFGDSEVSGWGYIPSQTDDTCSSESVVSVPFVISLQQLKKFMRDNREWRRRNRTKLLLPIDASSTSIVNEPEMVSQETDMKEGYVLSPSHLRTFADALDQDLAADDAQQQLPPVWSLSETSGLTSASGDPLPFKPSFKHLKFRESNVQPSLPIHRAPKAPSYLISTFITDGRFPDTNAISTSVEPPKPGRKSIHHHDGWNITQSLLMKLLKPVACPRRRSTHIHPATIMQGNTHTYPKKEALPSWSRFTPRSKATKKSLNAASAKGYNLRACIHSGNDCMCKTEGYIKGLSLSNPSTNAVAAVYQVKTCNKPEVLPEILPPQHVPETPKKLVTHSKICQTTMWRQLCLKCRPSTV